MDAKIENLKHKLDKAARLSRKQQDAVSLAHEAFYEAFDKCIPDCCGCKSDCSPECRINTLFWNYIIDSELPDGISTLDDLVFEMLRLMNEIEKKGDE